jgi:hypothetical protein
MGAPKEEGAAGLHPQPPQKGEIKKTEFVDVMI